MPRDEVAKILNVDWVPGYSSMTRCSYTYPCVVIPRASMSDFKEPDYELEVTFERRGGKETLWEVTLTTRNGRKESWP